MAGFGREMSSILPSYCVEAYSDISLGYYYSTLFDPTYGGILKIACFLSTLRSNSWVLKSPPQLLQGSANVHLCGFSYSTESGQLSVLCAHRSSVKARVHCHQECTQGAGHGVAGCVGEAHGVLRVPIGQLESVSDGSLVACGQASLWSPLLSQQDPHLFDGIQESCPVFPQLTPNPRHAAYPDVFWMP